MKNLPLISILLSTLLLFVLFPTKAHAAKLYIQPATGSYSSSFSADVYLDPETDTISAVDVVLTYDTTKLDVTEIVNGNFDQYISKSFNKALGKIQISALSVTNKASTITKIATVKFNPVGSGSTNLDFLFTPGAVDDSNAFDDGTESLTTVTGSKFTITTAGVPPTTTPTGGTTTPTGGTSGSGVGQSTTGAVPSTGAIPTSVFAYLTVSGVLAFLGLSILKR